MDMMLNSLGLLDDEDFTLDEAALVLAAPDHPGRSLSPERTLLGELGVAVAAAGTATTAWERAALLADVLAGDYGFQGDGLTYDDPANADLVRVLERRRGLPVALAILYVAAARRQGWIADPLNTPGHVLVRIGRGPQAVVIDPFGEGAPVTAPAIDQPGGRDAAPRRSVEALGNRATLVRLLMNQAQRARARGQFDRALVLFERMTEFAPAESGPWWERARLEQRLDRPGAARASLSAMLETTRNPALRAHVVSALEELARPV